MGARERWSDDDGFSLLELVVVTIILGILATIAIAVFLTQREKAERSSAISSARNTSTLAEAIRLTVDDSDSNYTQSEEAFEEEGGRGFTFTNGESTGPTVVSIATYEEDGTSPVSEGPIIVIASRGGGRCYWVRHEVRGDNQRGFQELDGSVDCTAADGSYVSITGGGW